MNTRYLIGAVALAAVGVGGYYLSQKSSGFALNSEEISKTKLSSSAESTNPVPNSNHDRNTLKTSSDVALSSSRQSASIKPLALPTENSLIDNQGATFNANRTVEILSSDQFEKTFMSLQQEQFENPFASEITNAYEELFNAFPDSSYGSAVELTEISCGMRLCMGSVITPNDPTAWATMVTQHLGNEDQSMFGAMVHYEFPVNETEMVHRFLFSINPDERTLSSVSFNQPITVSSGPPPGVEPEMPSPTDGVVPGEGEGDG